MHLYIRIIYNLYREDLFLENEEGFFFYTLKRVFIIKFIMGE